jgi:hypothetical protein
MRNGPATWEYFEQLEWQLYGTKHFPGSRYGHSTSNFVESANSVREWATFLGQLLNLSPE